MSPADQSKLQSLYGTIRDAISNGQLALLPSWFPGNAPVNAALNSLGASAGLTIAGVTATYPGGASPITIVGSVTLGSATFAAQLVIGLDAAQNYTIAIALPPSGQSSPLSMTLPSTPWFTLANPSISVASSPVLTGSIAGSITVGGSTCAASATLSSDGTWSFSLTWAAPGPSLNSVFQFVGGINLAAALPAPLNTISTLDLQTLGFTYDFSKQMLTRFTVAMNGSYPWDLFNNGQLVLQTFAFTFTTTRAPDKSGAIVATTTWTAASSFTVNGNGPLDVTLSYATPTFTLSAAPDPKGTPVTLVDFVDAFLSTQGPLLPESLSPVTVQSLSATFSPASGKAQASYNIGVVLAANASWALGGTFTVTSLGFAVDATKSTTTGSITGQLELFASQLKPLQLGVSAAYSGTEWVLSTTQVPKTSTDVASILGGLGITVTQPNFDVTGVSVIVHTGSTSPSPYLVVAGSVQNFSMPFTLPVQLDAVAGCFGISLGSTSGATVSPACLHGEVTLPFASIAADTTWWGVPITFGYQYAGSPSYTITYVESPTSVLTATLAKPQNDWIGTIAFTGSTSVGSMVEAFVSWATGYSYGLASPWNLLDDISLSGLSLAFDFTAETVSVTMGVGIDLGFCSVSGITLTYNATPGTGQNSVDFSVDGSFLWNAGSTDPNASTTKLTWDATKPESTKAPPGKGNGYLDLRFLGLGQYIDVKGVAGALTVQDAITQFETNSPAPPASDPPTLPNVTYDPKTSWLIGLDLGLLQLSASDDPPNGYCVTVQIVFDDPNLYGLRLALAGEPAKVLGGLDFEIMYRKISDTLGVYQAEITLPAKMRTIQTGIYTIMLPTFGVAVYTNGDFLIDIGFPWNADFSRSFTVQAIIAPGIPMMGSGGFYFGKLSSATSTSVPAVTNGTFDPVIVFGFGAQVGFGKSVSIGPLSASFSLTVLAIIQGVIARWNGFTSSAQPAPQDPTQIDGTYYYSLTGTFGIAGTLNGSIDFVIIKASVSISITVTAQITFAAYSPIVLSINVYVDVSASLEINCGLFSFSISFHFSLHLNESFSIPSPSSGSPPWQIAASSTTSLTAPPEARMTRVRRARRRLLDSATGWQPGPNFNNLSPATTVLPLQGYLTFALTAAGDEYAASNPNQVCYVATLTIDAQNPLSASHPSLPAGACALAGDTSWEALCKLVARWVLAAFWSGPIGCDPTAGIDAQVITEAQLLTIHEYLAQEDEQGQPLPNPDPLPIDPGQLETMLEQQISMTLTGPSDNTSGTVTNVQAAFFPMPAAMSMSIPDLNYSYTFGGYNTIAATDLPLLQAYFNQIAVQVQKEQQAQRFLAMAIEDVPSLSVAGFVFADYFLLIARQMIADLQAGLRDYKFPYVATNGALPSVKDIVDAITAAGGMLPGVPPLVHDPHDPPNPPPNVPYTAADVFAFNPGMALAPNQTLTIAGSSTKVQSTDSFASIAANAGYGGAFGAADVALLNAGNATLLQPTSPPGTAHGTPQITYQGTTLSIDSGDTLTSLALRFSTVTKTTVTAADLAADAGIQQEQLFIPLATIELPPFTVHTGSADTVASIAAAYNVTPASLGLPLPNGTNPNAGIAGLFAPPSGNAYVDVPHLTQLAVGSLIAEVQQTGSLDTLSAMVSRFHLHGLRLPTATTDPAQTLIAPNALGMWVTGSSGAYQLPPAAGLFALTGQQFPIPEIGSTPFVISLGAGPSWIEYTSAGSGTIQITNAKNDLYDPPIEALRNLVTQANYRFVSGYTVPDAASQLVRTRATFSLGTYQNWLGAALPPLPAPPPPSGAVPRIWPFPNGLSSILNSETHAIDPNFVLQTQTYDQATGTTQPGSLTNYAWASTFEFTVKRLPATSSDPATSGSPASAQTYQVVGADASSIVLLEDIVAQFPTDANLWGLWLAYAPDPSLRTSGLQTFGEGTIFGIGQANLSTVTRPPSAAMMLEEESTATATNGPVALNGNAMFVRLLWEASITNSGGFFLYYRDGDDPLPDYLFDKHGNAVLTGVLVYGTTTNAENGAAAALYDCMNAVVVTDPFDPSGSALVAEAVATAVSAPPSLALSQIAAQYYADLGDTAHRNAGLALATGAQIAVNEGTYLVPPPTLQSLFPSTPATIATWFGTTPSALQNANPSFSPWPATPTTAFAPNKALHLPPSTIAAGATAGDGQTVLSTLGTIAAYYAADVVGLAVDNQNTANLFGSAPAIEAGPWTTSSKLPPGSQLLQLVRDVPPGGSDPANLMLTQFSMLGYQIVANQDFQESNLGIPVGPISTGGASGVGKLRRVNRLAANAAGGWEYDVSLAYTGRLKGATPSSSPYLGVGTLLQVDLGWYDCYGNSIASDLSTPEPHDPGPPNQTPTLLGYTDALVGLGQWPSANASWSVAGAAGSPQLTLAFSFDTTRYSGKEAQAHAQADLAVYAQLVAQLPQTTANPGVGDANGAFSIVANLSTTPIPVGDPNLTSLVDWVLSIASYLAQIANGQTPANTPAVSLPLVFDLAIAALPAEQIFELTCGFTFARTGGVVEGEFAAIPGIRATTTSLPPTMPAMKSGTPGLVTFATDFETAYAGASSTLKVATGPNRFDAGTAASSTLWAVQVGTPATATIAGTPISYAIQDAGAPLIFAPEPISNQLTSNSAGIWTYTSGTPIVFENPPSYTQSFAEVDLDQWVRQLFNAVDALLGPTYISALTILDAHTPGTLSALQDHKKSLAAMYAQQMQLVFTDQSGSNAAVVSAFEQAMYEQLGNAYSTQAALQYTAGVCAGPIDEVPPNLYGPVTQSGATTAIPGVAFAPAKIPLQPPTTPVPSPIEPLPVLVTTPTQTGNATDQFVSVDLAYTASHIEHQIAPPDTSGYQASSWLQFVNPPASFSESLGTVQIPMILRAYPNSPVLATQSGPSTVADPTTVTEATEWTYAFVYSLPMHYPQDVVNISVEFNLQPVGELAAATFADSFAALAEFVTVYPQIVPDLEGQLATLTTTAPAKQVATALAAVQSVTAILDRIAPPPPPPGHAATAGARRFRFVPKRRAYAGTSSVTCTIQETQAGDLIPPVIVPHGDPTSLVISVVAPQGSAIPWVELSAQYVDPSNPGDAQYVTYPAGPPTTDPTTQSTTQQYYVVDTTQTPAKPVPFATAQGYGPRAVLYPALQILDLQNAQASASVTRNQRLVPGRTTADAFVYQTQEVTYTAPLRPTTVQTSAIDVGAIAPPPPPAPTVGNAPRPLADSLTALFYTLVEGASATSASLQLTVAYRYQLSGSPITIPILMQPALAVSWASGNDTLAPMIVDLAGAIAGWFGQVLPIGGGQLLISLTVLPSGQQVPLVRLTSLELALSDIQPRLPVAAVTARS